MIDVCILRFHRQQRKMTKEKSKWKEEKGVKVVVAVEIQRTLAFYREASREKKIRRTEEKLSLSVSISLC